MGVTTFLEDIVYTTCVHKTYPENPLNTRTKCLRRPGEPEQLQRGVKSRVDIRDKSDTGALGPPTTRRSPGVSQDNIHTSHRLQNTQTRCSLKHTMHTFTHR